MPKRREMLTIEQAVDYTDYNPRMLREAVKRGELHAERPGGGRFSRLYFDAEELDRWLDTIAVA